LYNQLSHVMNRNRLTLLALLLYLHSDAQINLGGTPLRWQSAALPEPSTVVLPRLDVAKAFKEDTENQGQHRFAAPIAADLSFENAGNWTQLPNGDRVWQCALQAPGALGLVLLFDQFNLPEGSRFYAFTPNQTQVFGAYSAQSCSPNGKFTIGVLKGETTLLEYYEPVSVKQAGKIHLFRADYAYDQQALQEGAEALVNFGLSLPCNVNVNCPAGANWQTEKKGVARILMVFSNGSGWCSGSLIANTGGTYDPYFLTAHHCQLIGQNPAFELWRFDFDYEAVGCSNPATEPQPRSVLGCERISYRTETDFMLLKTNPIPINYGVYFNGWNRSTSPAARTTFIHHPVGDIKKISVDTQAAVLHPETINWTGIFGISPVNTHWRVIPDIGIYQAGSSGSPLFDPNKRIVGQLHGGNANPANECLIVNSFWGRFDLSWSQGSSPQSRLKEWLDPNNLGSQTQNGYQQVAPNGFPVSGNIKTFWDVPLAGVQVYLNGSALDTVVTDTAGNFTFPFVPAGGSYSITARRDSNALNGVSTFDLVLISKHVLGIQALDSPWKIIAADANRSNSVTSFDIVESRKLLLGINTVYASSPSWRFYPAFITFSNPQQPFGNPLPEQIAISNLQGAYTNANFKAVKVGDVNVTANPNE